jgi:hypothetical protein
VHRRLLIALVAFSLPVPGYSQQALTATIVNAEGAGGFTLRRIPGRPGIDGRAWMMVDVQTGQSPVYRPAGADYELRFNDADNTGDFERWSVTLERPGRPPVPLTARDKTSFVAVTPDARYIFVEPLFVIDVKTFRRYALHEAFGLQPYISIVATTRDGRLFIERSSCTMDCSRRTDEEFFELTVPPE